MNSDAAAVVKTSLKKLEELEGEVRECAYRSVDAYIHYIYATAAGGAGPVALPPFSTGTSSTTGTFKCPSCAYNGTVTYR